MTLSEPNPNPAAAGRWHGAAWPWCLPSMPAPRCPGGNALCDAGGAYARGEGSSMMRHMPHTDTVSQGWAARAATRAASSQPRPPPARCRAALRAAGRRTWRRWPKIGLGSGPRAEGGRGGAGGGGGQRGRGRREEVLALHVPDHAEGAGQLHAGHRGRRVHRQRDPGARAPLAPRAAPGRPRSGTCQWRTLTGHIDLAVKVPHAHAHIDPSAERSPRFLSPANVRGLARLARPKVTLRRAATLFRCCVPLVPPRPAGGAERRARRRR
jgi:hypothetical protein